MSELNSGRGDQVGGRGQGRGNGRGGQGRGNGDGRGNNDGGRGQRNTRFEGQEPSLWACSFDYSEDPHAKQYIKNIKLLTGYVVTKYSKYNVDFQKELESLSLPMLAAITEPDDKDGTIAIKKWEMEVKRRGEQVLAYEEFLSSLFSLLLGQCMEPLKDKLRAQSEYEAIMNDHDGIKMLALIKKTTFTYDSKRFNPVSARDKLKYELYAPKQRPGQPIHEFYEVYKAKLKVCQEVGLEL